MEALPHSAQQTIAVRQTPIVVVRNALSVHLTVQFSTDVILNKLRGLLQIEFAGG